MSVQRRKTAPPGSMAIVVTESLRADSLRKYSDPFSESPPGTGLGSATPLTQSVFFFVEALFWSNLIFSGTPGVGANAFLLLLCAIEYQRRAAFPDEKQRNRLFFGARLQEKCSIPF